MKITIIIPIYNGELYLNRCIESCCKQTYENIEILLINDGSTDRTEEIIKDYENKDSRIRHINQFNQGLVRSRKNGVKKTNTNYFVFLDADDILELNAIEKLLQEYNRTNSDLIFANFITELENGYHLAYSNNTFTGNYEADWVMDSILRKKIAPTIWGKLIAKTLFLQTDVPDDITIGEDAIALAQMLCHNPKISAINDNIYHYIQRESSMVNTKSKTKNLKRLKFMEYFKKYIIENFGYTKNNEISLKHFMIGEVFDILRDGGNFTDIKQYYEWITSDIELSNYKSSIGHSRILLIKSFIINKTFGNFCRFCYNNLRMMRNILFKL